MINSKYSAGLVSQSFWFVEFKKIVNLLEVGKSVPSDLIGSFNIIFYSSAEDAVFKALGEE